MHKTKRIKTKSGMYPSLYDAFNLGDRVSRVHRTQAGESQIYRGMVMAIDKKSIEVYWDTMDGKYRPNNMKVAFTTCQIDEIFGGDGNYSPIRKKEY